MSNRTDSLRRELVELLAVNATARTTDIAMLTKPEARREVKRISAEIGVREALLYEAVELARSGFKTSVGSDFCIRLDAYITLDMYVCIDQMLPRFHIKTHGKILRALMHMAMQHDRDPTDRAEELWKLPLPGLEGFRKSLIESAMKKDAKKYDSIGRQSDRMFHVHTRSTRGLVRAIEMRATAMGTDRSRYVRLWLADLADGLLSEWPLVPVGTSELFGDPKMYMIPEQFSRGGKLVVVGSSGVGHVRHR